MTLDECLIGQEVIYTAPHGQTERGVITEVRSGWVFVRYLGDSHSKATAPRELARVVDPLTSSRACDCESGYDPESIA